ncbi:MAG TPA: fumarylacetoacetate hydrolase [Burkholderiales bacterium]|nr:fumarylacetoacetate hydrolase [Burkholderiales bacterium]
MSTRQILPVNAGSDGNRPKSPRASWAYSAAAWLLGVTSGLMGALPAGAACPSHEKVSAMIRAWEANEPVRGLRTDLSMADAECGQNRLVQKLELALGPVVGYKAGLTNPAVQKRFGVTAPLRGALLQRMLLREGKDVPARFGARPVFEADLLVVVKDPAIHRARTHLEALRSLSLIVPFIELPDLVVAEGEKLTAPLIVFINVGARLGVTGKGVPVEVTEDFVERLATMRVRVTDQDGKELATADGAAILGHPLNAVLWLAQDLERSGVKLKSGDLLSLGSFTAPMPPRAGLAVTVQYEGLPGNPRVSVQFR